MKPLSFVVFAVIVTFSWTGAALAAGDGPLLAAAKRAAAEVAAQPEPSRLLPAPAVAAADAATPRRAASQSPQAAPGGSRSGMKIALAIGAAVAFAAAVYAIDSNVENNTPSSLGTRKD